MTDTVTWTWDELLAAFRALGGVADNVVIRSGPHGRGLYPKKAGQPVKLFAPPNLLFKVDEMIFEGGRLTLQPDAQVTDAERAFFDNYHAAFGWGGGGRADCESFLARLAAVPANLRQAVNTELMIEGFFEGDKDAANRAQSRFLGTRKIKRGEHMVLMPVLELVNHTPTGPLMDLKEGARLDGVFDGEIRFRYAVTDALGVFTSWGFASDEVTAYSLPLTFRFKTGTVAVNRQTAKAVKGGQFRPPAVTKENGATVLSHVLLGHRSYPKLAKTQFYAAMREAGVTDAETIFDTVAHHNRLRYLKVLDLLEDRPGDLMNELRRMARFQLNALSYALGDRSDEGAAEAATRETALAEEP
ncbi:MAG TPA: hypothetical protein VG407_00435 [Caulobacteraceae bacterium]|nr:hypothetical protein [Caulobacteraceae bacterium]